MKLLLDTHAFLWSLLEPEQLSAQARNAIIQPENQVYVSAVSFWEIALKTRLGKLTLQGATPESLIDAATRQGFDLLPLEPRHAASFHNLPPTSDHRDPFDRMLIWQAMSLELALVSRDRRLAQHAPAGLQLVW